MKMSIINIKKLYTIKNLIKIIKTKFKREGFNSHAATEADVVVTLKEITKDNKMVVKVK